MEVTLRAVGGQGDDVNKGRNKARSVLEQSSLLSHGGWTVGRTCSGERPGCEWEQEGEASEQIQRREEEAPPSTVSVRVEKSDHPYRQAGRGLRQESLKAPVEQGRGTVRTQLAQHPGLLSPSGYAH